MSILKTKYERAFYSPAELSKLLGLNSRVILRLIHNNSLPASNVGSGKRAVYRVSVVDLEKFIKKNNHKNLEKYEREKPRKLPAADQEDCGGERTTIPNSELRGEDSPGISQEDAEIDLLLRN